MAETIHQGRNVKRFREMARLKQEGLASLGEEWNQKRISLLESKEVVDEGLLEQVAKVLKVTPEVIKKFEEEAGINYFNSFYDNSFNNSSAGVLHASHYNFNPLDKYVEAVEKNEKLHEENKKLYERLLETEMQKNEVLQQLLTKK